MKRMHTKNEIEAIAEEAGGGFDPSTIEAGNVPQDAVLGLDEEGKIIKGSLFGKYVRIMPAPADFSHLTDEEFAAIKEGVFFKGDWGQWIHNPVFFPPVGNLGVFMAGNSIIGYQLGDHSVITLNTSISFDQYNNITIDAIQALNLTSRAAHIRLNGKDYPTYPATQADKSFHFVLNNGAIEWQEGNGLYLHNLTFTDSTSATRYLSVITDSATPFELVSGTGPTLIQCADASIVIVPDSGKSLPMYNNKSFHPTVYSLSFPSGSTSVEYTSYNISTLDQDEVHPL